LKYVKKKGTSEVKTEGEDECEKKLLRKDEKLTVWKDQDRGGGRFKERKTTISIFDRSGMQWRRKREELQLKKGRDQRESKKKQAIPFSISLKIRGKGSKEKGLYRMESAVKEGGGQGEEKITLTIQTVKGGAKPHKSPLEKRKGKEISDYGKPSIFYNRVKGGGGYTSFTLEQNNGYHHPSATKTGVQLKTIRKSGEERNIYAIIQPDF